MRPIFLFTFLLIFGLCSAQETDRTRIDGKVSVPMGDNPQGITVVNATSGAGTITNEAGTFRIGVSINDTLQFSAVQFQEFSVVIDQGVLNAGRLIVEISEAVNELPEVVVSPSDLSGYVEVDVARIPTEDIDLPEATAYEIEDTDWDFRPDAETSPQNAAMRNEMIFSGQARNFGNIFRHIFASRSTRAVSGQEPDERRELSDIDDQIQQLYDDEFFTENLGIQRKNIYEFIYFAEDNGLSPEMLEPENEMDLIRFLMEQSERYKEQ